MEIYPNPSSDEVKIKFNLSESFNFGQITIFDVTGKNIMNFQINDKPEEIVISDNELTPGIYFVKLSVTSGIVETEKIIKF